MYHGDARARVLVGSTSAWPIAQASENTVFAVKRSRKRVERRCTWAAKAPLHAPEEISDVNGDPADKSLV